MPLDLIGDPGISKQIGSICLIRHSLRCFETFIANLLFRWGEIIEVYLEFCCRSEGVGLNPVMSTKVPEHEVSGLE